MVCRLDVWGLANDLTPTPETFERCVHDQVWPATAAFRGGRLSAATVPDAS